MIDWLPWRRKKPAKGVGDEEALEREAEAAQHRRLSLERTYQAVQAQERDIRTAVERVQAELDVLRREH